MLLQAVRRPWGASLRPPTPPGSRLGSRAVLQLRGHCLGGDPARHLRGPAGLPFTSRACPPGAFWLSTPAGRLPFHLNTHAPALGRREGDRALLRPRVGTCAHRLGPRPASRAFISLVLPAGLCWRLSPSSSQPVTAECGPGHTARTPGSPCPGRSLWVSVPGTHPTAVKTQHRRPTRWGTAQWTRPPPGDKQFRA